jgi:DNA-binding GntR family transcriptional regulator
VYNAQKIGKGINSLITEMSTLEVQRRGLVEQITHLLRQQILSGGLPPGTRLLQEKVAAQLRVSRTPLREAFRVLEQDGLIRVIASNRSVEVVPISRRRLVELYEVREVLDGLAARLAATRSDKASREGLSAMLSSLTNKRLSYEERMEAHTELHTAIVRASDNSQLIQMLPIVTASAWMLHSVIRSNPKRLLASLPEHEAIVQAIQDGNGTVAERLARRHIANAREVWSHYVQE